MDLREVTPFFKKKKSAAGILPRLRIVRGTDTVRRQLTASCCTTSEFKRLSKHYAGESHNNDQRSNKRHKVVETASERQSGKKKKKKKSLQARDGEERE